MFSSLKQLFRPSTRDLVMIDRGELEALRGASARADTRIHALIRDRDQWHRAAISNERAANRAEERTQHAADALRAITALPDTVRVTRAKAIAREALGE